jgi:hypothetical protein
MFKYQAFEFAKENMTLDEKYEILGYNRGILRAGVEKVTLLETREPTRGERLDYEQFAPNGSMLSSVEVYANGALNIFVRSKLLAYVIGVITFRPMKPYNVAEEYKTRGEKNEKISNNPNPCNNS